METSRHILVVEDVSADFELITHELVKDSQRFDTKRIDSTRELADEFDRQEPDIVLCDHGSAKWDSFAVLQQVRERNSNLPFIVVTGAMDEAAVVRVLEGGADDLVFKHQLARLGPAIRRALRLADEIRLRRTAERERDQMYWKLESMRSRPAEVTPIRICTDCKMIPDPKCGWTRLEDYFDRHHRIRFSHGLCPACVQKYYADFR